MAQKLALTTYLNATNADYIADLYRRYLQSPASVDASWQTFFRDLNDADAALLRELDGASWTPDQNRRGKGFYGLESGDAAAKTAKGQAKNVANDPAKGAAAPAGAPVSLQDGVRIGALIAAYRDKGHRLGHYDPLGLVAPAGDPELDPAAHGFAADDYERPFALNGLLGLQVATLRQIVTQLRQIYGGTIGLESAYLYNAVERQWLQSRMEGARVQLTAAQKKEVLKRITAAEGLEQFLHTKFQGAKRFGADGIESMIPALEAIMETCVKMGAREFVYGMAHRGRLNVLTNICGKPYTKLLAEFQGVPTAPTDLPGSGDVKYHMGYSQDRVIEGETVHITLTPNPSHLEQVNPVVVGRARAKQKLRKDTARKAVVPILLHGDAAFAGQGIVPETLQMAELKAYNVGGTIHIITNNQVGFTTDPVCARSGPYSSDMAKIINIPIFHVNADDVDAVVQVAIWAAEYRQTFGRDVLIDLIGYRRYGHNEGDEPAFTQPVMYKTIAARAPVRRLYAEQLAREGVLSEAEAEQYLADINKKLADDFEASKNYKPNKADWLEANWSGFTNGAGGNWYPETGVDEKRLKQVGDAVIALPGDFALNSKIARQFETKKAMFESGAGIDWGTGEALAFGTLLQDGYDVRLTGEDVGRGTFSHRHATLRDQNSNQPVTPLKAMTPNYEGCEIYESHLSELATVGYEYGYSYSDPKTLTLWEGQFGDFVNGAQMIIDQFICSGETKWLRFSGMVMLLPHGMEGQGPEHSSARLERFLQLSAEDNWQVCNITTPANYFHALRRQMVRNFRKPLIVMSPKSLLRHKLAVSDLKEFAVGTAFQPVLADREVSKAKRVILCSGKVYYDLYEERAKRNINNIAIVRVEQLYPFPAAQLEAVLKDHPNADIVWCQEEPENQGAWQYVDRRIEAVLTAIRHKTARPRYVGRPAAAAPACGYLKRHNEEQARLVDEALKA